MECCFLKQDHCLVWSCLSLHCFQSHPFGEGEVIMVCLSLLLLCGHLAIIVGWAKVTFCWLREEITGQILVLAFCDCIRSLFLFLCIYCWNEWRKRKRKERLFMLRRWQFSVPRDTIRYNSGSFLFHLPLRFLNFSSFQMIINLLLVMLYYFSLYENSSQHFAVISSFQFFYITSGV